MTELDKQIESTSYEYNTLFEIIYV